MKTMLSLWGCFALLYLSVSGQSLEVTIQPGFFSEGQFIEKLGTDQLVVAGEQRPNTPTSTAAMSLAYLPYIIVMDATGTILWEHRFEEMGHTARLKGLKVTADERIIVYGYFAGCDYAGPGFFYEFNQDGEVLFKYVDQDNEPSLPIIFNLDIFPNGDFLIPSFSKVNRIDRDIMLVNGYNYRKREYLDVVTQTDSTFLAVSLEEDSSISISPFVSFDSIMISNLPKVTALPPGREFYQIRKVEDQYALLTEGFLSVFQFPHFQFIDFNLSDHGRFTRFDYHNSHFAFLGKDPLDQPIILYTDTAFQSPTIIPIDIPNFTPADLTLTDETIIVTGSHFSFPAYSVNLTPGFSHPYGSSALLIREVELNGVSPNTEHDLTITDINWAAGPHLTPHGCSDTTEQDCPATFNYTFSGIEVQVKNLGPTTINSLTLNTRKEGCKSCSAICYITYARSEDYHSLNLAPNEERTLSFGDITFKDQRINTTFDLCFWASVPNNRRDINPENDVFCQPIPWEFGPVNYKQNNLHIFPNPTHSDLVVEFRYLPETPVVFEVFNALGQPVHQGLFPAQQNQHIIDVSTWSSGNYILAVFEGDKIERRQFVIGK